MLDAFVNFMIPQGSNADARLRARQAGVIRTLLIISALVLIVITPYLLIRKSAPPPEVAALLGCMLAPLLGIFALRLTGKISAAVLLTSVVGSACITVIAYFTGGLHSFILPANLANLALTSAFGSVRLILAGGGTILASLAVLVALETTANIPPSDIVPVKYVFLHLVTLAASGILMAWSGVVAIRMRERSKKLLKEAKLEAENLASKAIESERKFRRIVQTTMEGYWLIDPNTKETIEVNDALCKMLGYTVEEMLGKKPTDFCDEENAQIFRTQTALISEVDHRSYNIVLKAKDGRDVPAFFNATTVWGDDGRPVSAFAFVTDMTEQRRTLAELEKARETAERANQAKSDFLSSMSHELRTPMNAILGFAQLLEYDPRHPLAPVQKQNVGHIITGGNHLLELINQILDLARIESGKISLEIDDVDPGPVIEECLNLIDSMASKRRILIKDRYAGKGTARIRVDQTRFKQILLNFLTNAVKYNRDSGQITIAANVANGLYRLSVSDTGNGISEKHHDSVFMPFNRLGAESTDIEGTGIGLTIARELVEAMNGKIGFESKVGDGSTFWVEFPVAVLGKMEDHAEIYTDDGGITPLTDGQHTLLYVEDNPANLNLMEKIVDHIPNLTMISAHTAELGLELAEARLPEVIIMDINLPGMDGYEALKHLKANKATRLIPVIALSANAMPHDIEKGRKADFFHYLTKPVQINNLMNALNEAIALQDEAGQDKTAS
ncbi:MAG: ATP-binding protein [Rhodospirillales bacterium]|nr:ATP-binding protein [Rhodospirillales bacterium]